MLSRQPKNARAHYLLAVCALRARQQDQALGHLAAALRFDRANPQYHELAASCHAAAGRWSEAIAAQRRVLQYRPEDASAWGSLGYFERMSGRAPESLAALARALAIAPRFAPAHNERAMALVQAGRKEEGIEALRRAVEIDPGFLTAWRNLAKLLYLDHVVALQEGDGRPVDGSGARAAIERVLSLDPNDVEFGYLRDALNQARMARPPDAFVEGFFDRFAAQFDERLVGELGYTGPEAARELLAPYIAKGAGRALDLGCGTGLSGAILREASTHLVGVDLSTGMLAKARERGLYDELVHAEIGAYLEGVAPHSIDLALALDVFIYVGELERVVVPCAAALAPGGLLAFSTEKLAQGDYVLQPMGRYAHSDAYVRTVAVNAGLELVEAREIAIRTEANRPVAAVLHLFRKAAAGESSRDAAVKGAHPSRGDDMKTTSRHSPRILALASSLLVAGAAQAAEMMLFKHPNFEGRQVTLRGYTPNLASIGFQDQASSIVINSGRWEVCSQPDFKGDCVTLNRGEYPTLDVRLNHRIESAREVGSYASETGSYSGYGRGAIELYGQPGFRGRSMPLDRDAPTLEGSGFDDRASSLVVTEGTWQLCSEPGYSGTCRNYAPGRYPDLGYGMAKEISSARLVRAHRQAPAVVSGGYEAPAPAADGSARVILFSGENFRGDSVALSGAIGTLDRAGFDDAAASVIVEGGRWMFCTEPYFRGECKVMAPGRYRLRDAGLHRSVSSLRPVGAADVAATPRRNPDADIELFLEPDFRGRAFASKRDISNLGPTNYNDTVASVVVNSGQWELCTDGEYRGRCVVFGPGRHPNLGGLTNQISSLRRVR